MRFFTSILAISAATLNPPKTGSCRTEQHPIIQCHNKGISDQDLIDCATQTLRTVTNMTTQISLKLQQVFLKNIFLVKYKRNLTVIMVLKVLLIKI